MQPENPATMSLTFWWVTLYHLVGKWCLRFRALLVFPPHLLRKYKCAKLGAAVPCRLPAVGQLTAGYGGAEAQRIEDQGNGTPVMGSPQHPIWGKIAVQPHATCPQREAGNLYQPDAQRLDSPWVNKVAAVGRPDDPVEAMAQGCAGRSAQGSQLGNANEADEAMLSLLRFGGGGSPSMNGSFPANGWHSYNIFRMKGLP